MVDQRLTGVPATEAEVTSEIVARIYVNRKVVNLNGRSMLSQTVRSSLTSKNRAVHSTVAAVTSPLCQGAVHSAVAAVASLALM